MKRFHFRLEKLLEVRAYEQSICEAALARKNGAVAVLEHALMDNASASLQAAKERFKPGGRARDFQAAERYAQRLGQERDKLMKGLAAAELERDKAREAYIAATKAKELIEKLKERAESSYYKAAALEETKVLDDLGSIARARNMKLQRES
jgi:flagellar protein FliJ